MMAVFDVGVRVKGKPDTQDADKIGTVVEKQRFINGSRRLVNLLYVQWDGETEEKEKNEDDLDIA